MVQIPTATAPVKSEREREREIQRRGRVRERRKGTYQQEPKEEITTIQEDRTSLLVTR